MATSAPFVMGILEGTAYSCTVGRWDQKLRIDYPCGSGGTAGSLSKLVIANRQDCCQARIQHVKVCFLGAFGQQDRPCYIFSTVENVYTLTGVEGGGGREGGRQDAPHPAHHRKICTRLRC
jgi:hypothetical protein